MRACVYANVACRSRLAFRILSSLFFAKFETREYFFGRAARKCNQLGPDRVANRNFFGYAIKHYLRASQAHEVHTFPKEAAMTMWAVAPLLFAAQMTTAAPATCPVSTAVKATAPPDRTLIRYPAIGISARSTALGAGGTARRDANRHRPLLGAARGNAARIHRSPSRRAWSARHFGRTKRISNRFLFRRTVTSLLKDAGRSPREPARARSHSSQRFDIRSNGSRGSRRPASRGRRRSAESKRARRGSSSRRWRSKIRRASHGDARGIRIDRDRWRG